jgi:hypothetical protein
MGKARKTITRIKAKPTIPAPEKPFMRLAGIIDGGPPDLSMRKGFSTGPERSRSRV